jgi:DNA-binding NtrC family response regulator
MLQTYPWPENVRELKNTLEGMAVLSEEAVLTERDLPYAILAGRPPAESESTGGVTARGRLEDMERDLILKALEECRGNRTHAAARVGISVRTLQRKLRQWGVAEDAPGCT